MAIEVETAAIAVDSAAIVADVASMAAAVDAEDSAGAWVVVCRECLVCRQADLGWVFPTAPGDAKPADPNAAPALSRLMRTTTRRNLGNPSPRSSRRRLRGLPRSTILRSTATTPVGRRQEDGHKLQLPRAPWPFVLEQLATISGMSLDWQQLPVDGLNLRTHAKHTAAEARRHDQRAPPGSRLLDPRRCEKLDDDRRQSAKHEHGPRASRLAGRSRPAAAARSGEMLVPSRMDARRQGGPGIQGRPFGVCPNHPDVDHQSARSDRRGGEPEAAGPNPRRRAGTWWR